MITFTHAALKIINDVLDKDQRLDWLRWQESPTLITEERARDLLHLILNALNKDTFKRSKVQPSDIIFGTAAEYVEWLKAHNYIQPEPQRKWSEPKLAIIKDMIAQGKTYEQIGTHFGVSYSSIASTVSLYKLRA